MNTEKILEGLRAAKQAFQETLDFCKKDGVDMDYIQSFAYENNTHIGICFHLKQIRNDYALDFVQKIFKGCYLCRYAIVWSDCTLKRSISSTTKRVEWLESKIKELEVAE